MYFSDKVNEYNNSFSGKTVVLDSDIDLQGVALTSIGQTGATQFLGTFDGKGRTISNLSINNTDEGKNCATGLFGWLNSAVVKNVRVYGAEISGHHNVGTIAGYLETSGCTIEGCTVLNSAISAGRDAGQVAGAAKEANVVGCSATGVTVTANGSSTGANIREEVIGRVL